MCSGELMIRQEDAFRWWAAIGRDDPISCASREKAKRAASEGASGESGRAAGSGKGSTGHALRLRGAPFGVRPGRRSTTDGRCRPRRVRSWVQQRPSARPEENWGRVLAFPEMRGGRAQGKR